MPQRQHSDLMERLRLGAVIGSCVGLALIGLLILLPAVLGHSFYEVSDVLLVKGAPLLVIGTAIGAMVGVAVSRSHREPPSQPRRRTTIILVVVGLIGCVLAVWLFEWGTGRLDALR